MRKLILLTTLLFAGSNLFAAAGGATGGCRGEKTKGKAVAFILGLKVGAKVGAAIKSSKMSKDLTLIPLYINDTRLVNSDQHFFTILLQEPICLQEIQDATLEVWEGDKSLSSIKIPDHYWMLDNALRKPVGEIYVIIDKPLTESPTVHFSAGGKAAYPSSTDAKYDSPKDTSHDRGLRQAACGTRKVGGIRARLRAKIEQKRAAEIAATAAQEAKEALCCLLFECKGEDATPPLEAEKKNKKKKKKKKRKKRKKRK